LTEQTLKQLTGFLGLCGRAGQTTLGQDACVDAVRRENAALVLLDEDSGPTTRKRFLDSCWNHRVPLYGVPPGAIARALGKDGRMTVAVKRGNMAQKLFQLLESEIPLAGAEPGRNKPDPDDRKQNANNAGVQAVK
jgi:ribosomal protein L7Ae-like RNA K-turn-binding protein